MEFSTTQVDSSGGDSVYGSAAFEEIDIGEQMRLGHVDVAEGDRWILELVARTLSSHPGGATIVDIGSGSGVLSALLARAFPQHRVVANDIAPSNCRHAADRLRPYANASVFPQPLESWTEPVDVFISWGSHHHLAHDYLSQIRTQLRRGGRLIIGDEFCPEYLTPQELTRGRAWLIDGYLFTDEDERTSFKTTGQLPASVLHREELRRRALWTWYRYVIDEAVKVGDWRVAMVELQIARDDLTTGFAEEHKTSPLLLETELREAGFEIASTKRIGDRRAELQSFVVYEARPVVRPDA